MTDEESIAFLRSVQAKTTSRIHDPPTLGDAMDEFLKQLANRMVRAEFQQPLPKPDGADAKAKA
jgi:hypothetical protein